MVAVLAALMAAAVPRCPLHAALLHAAADISGQHTLRATLLTREGQQQVMVDNGEVQAMKQQAKVRAAVYVRTWWWWQRMPHACGQDCHAPAAVTLGRPAPWLLQACWASRGHPGWALLPLDTPAFEQSCCHLEQVLLPAEVAAAAVPQVPHASAGFLAGPGLPTAGLGSSFLAGAVAGQHVQLALQQAALPSLPGVMVPVEAWPASGAEAAAAVPAPAAVPMAAVPAHSGDSPPPGSASGGSPTAAGEQLGILEEFAMLGVQVRTASGVLGCLRQRPHERMQCAKNSSVLLCRAR